MGFTFSWNLGICWSFLSRSLRLLWSKIEVETIAVEGYQAGALTERQVRRLLDLESRFEVHALLKEHKVPLHYTEAGLEEDLAAHRDLGTLSGR